MTKDQTKTKSPTQMGLRWLATLMLIALFGGDVMSQVNYSQIFTLNNGGFTGNFLHFTGATTCGGSGGAMRRNLYSGATTGNMISPLTGTAAGGLITMSYSYKVANWSANTAGTANPWGSFNVQWSTTAAGPWTTVDAVNSGNHTVSGSCTTRTTTFTPSNGNTVFIKFDCFWSAGDYYLNFDNISLTEAAGPCSGAPTGGTTNADVNPVCSGVNFNLSVTGATNPLQTGLTYQWQSADDAAFTINVANLGTAVGQTTSQTAAKYYRRQITCTNSGLSDFSSVLNVTMNTLLNCYCAATHSSCSGDGVVNVTLNTLNNPSVGCPGAGNYTYFNPGISATTLNESSSYTLSVTVEADPSQFTNAWIDFNRDGILAASEALGATVNPGASGTATFNFTVPTGVAFSAGLTRLRVKGGVDGTFTTAQACGANIGSTFGEIEDYDITLAAIPPCSGTPSGGTSSIGTNPVCALNPTTLSLSGYTVATGITFQWQTGSNPGGPYTNIPGATTATYNYTPSTAGTEYIVCYVFCTNSSLGATSTESSLTVNASPNGVASGPATGLTYQNLNYTLTGYPGGTTFQWQSATAIGGPYTNIPAATADNLTAISNAGGTFYIRCWQTAAGCSAPSNVITTVVSVAGDNVCSALPLVIGNNGPYTNIGATSEVGEPSPPLLSCTSQTDWCPGGNTAINSVWFTFTAPASGRVAVRLNPNFTLWDSQFALYSAANCGAILTSPTLIAANDDSSGSPFNSYITPVCLVPGTTYYLKVDGYQTTTNGSWGILLIDAGYLGSTAAISGSMNTCAPIDGTVELAFTGSGPWTYNLTDGTLTATGSTASANYTANVPSGGGGTHTWTLVYALDNGCATINSGSAIVLTSTVAPSASVVVPPINNLPSYACNGTSVLNINVPSVSGATQYIWDGPSGTTLNGVNPYTASTPSADILFGTPPVGASGYYIGVQAANACGTSTRKVQWVRNNVSVPAAIIAANARNTECASTSANYSIAPVGGATSYLWSVTGDATVTPSGTSCTVNFGPTWTGGTLSVAAQTPCYTSPAKTFVLTNAAPAIGVMSGVFTACVGSTQTYSVPAAPGIASYSWSLPPNTTGSSTTNSINITFNPGFIGGNISVTATSICGVVTSPRTKSVAIGTPSTPASITGFANGICNSTVSYSCPPQGGVTFTWSSSVGTVISGQGSNSVSISFPTYTTGTVSVVASTACGSSSARTISVKGAPNATGTIIASPAVWCNNDAGIQFSSSTAGVSGTYTLNWSIVPASAASIVSGQGSNTVIVDWNTGNAVVSLTSSNACGNATRTYSATVGCREANSLVEESTSTMEVYPNPANDKLNISYVATQSSDLSYKLIDVTGKVVTSNTISVTEGANSHAIDIAGFAKGVYMLNVTSLDKSENIRVIVQ